jgi:hypothetical protein
MTGAEYIAYLGGPVRPVPNLDLGHWRGDTRALWEEIASGPLAGTIDAGEVVVCPDCLFVTPRFSPCHVCPHWRTIAPEDVREYLADLRENGGSPREKTEEYLTNLRIERVVELFSEPESAYVCGEALYVLDLLRAKAA